jgi:predicted Na+-dependent transporter
MNLKRIFGAILTVLGIIGLIYSAILFVNGELGVDNIKSLITYGLLSLLFFISGISLVRTTKDEA